MSDMVSMPKSLRCSLCIPDKIFIGGLMYFGQVVTAYGRTDAHASNVYLN